VIRACVLSAPTARRLVNVRHFRAQWAILGASIWIRTCAIEGLRTGTSPNPTTLPSNWLLIRFNQSIGPFVRGCCNLSDGSCRTQSNTAIALRQERWSRHGTLDLPSARKPGFRRATATASGRSQVRWPWGLLPQLVGAMKGSVPPPQRVQKRFWFGSNPAP